MKRVRRLGHHALAEEPLHQAVVELEVGLEIVAAQLHAAQDLGQALVVLAARRAVAEHQRDVRVVGAGQVVVDERAGVGIRRADALVEADLAGSRRRPAADQAAGVRLERLVRRVDAHLDAGERARHARRPRQPRRRARASSSIASISRSTTKHSPGASGFVKRSA